MSGELQGALWANEFLDHVSLDYERVKEYTWTDRKGHNSNNGHQIVICKCLPKLNPSFDDLVSRQL